MTSDAKIGLLLGLVFIFIIAFVINGLPGLHQKTDSNKLTTEMVGLQNSQPGLGANERKLALETAAPVTAQPENPAPLQQTSPQDDTRFTMALPQGTSADAATAVTEPIAAPPSQANLTALINPPDVSTSQVAPARVTPSAAQLYVVQDGDSLSSIAKKVYGDQQGNKIVAVKAIFEANRKTLVSIDDLQVGQKLIIPSLNLPASPAPTTTGVLSGSDFVKVDSVGKRNATATPANTRKQTTTKQDSAKTGRIYIVKEGDSLWRIAADQLGDGNRYKEIVKLNSSVLSSEDDIQVDMELKLPPK
jgi:nucleoid-associated protein YgaU